MDGIPLDPERFKLITTPEGNLVITDDHLLLLDTLTQDQVVVLATPEVLAAYGISTVNNVDTTAEADLNASCNEGSTDTLLWKGDDNAVLQLIHLWHDKESKFKSTSIKNDDVWKTIASELSAANEKWKFTWQQCRDKIKYIRKEYVKVKDNNSKSGNPPKTCRFFNEMDEILGDKPCVKPVSVASSTHKRPLPHANNVEDSSDSFSSGEGDEKDKTNPKKKKKTKVEKEIESWTLKLQADAKAREEARERRFERGLKVYEETMKKLIDKL